MVSLSDEMVSLSGGLEQLDDLPNSALDPGADIITDSSSRGTKRRDKETEIWSDLTWLEWADEDSVVQPAPAVVQREPRITSEARDRRPDALGTKALVRRQLIASLSPTRKPHCGGRRALPASSGLAVAGSALGIADVGD
jgi:hypothetical protein